MKKIVVIGISGAGKTTLAKTLGSVLKIAVLKIKVYHLDRIFWLREWKRIARERRIDILEDIVQREQWIIEGSYFELSDPSLNKADTIIFLDLPPLLCLVRVIKRHYKELLPRRDLPMECVDRLNLHLIKRVLFFRFTRRRAVIQKLYDYKNEGKEILIFRTVKEIDNFIAQQKVRIYEEVNAGRRVPIG